MAEDDNWVWLRRELDTLKSGQDDIKAHIDGKPCVEHGKELASLKQHQINGNALKEAKRDWFKVGMSVGMLILGIAMALIAYKEYAN